MCNKVALSPIIIMKPGNSMKRVKHQARSHDMSTVMNSCESLSCFNDFEKKERYIDGHGEWLTKSQCYTASARFTKHHYLSLGPRPTRSLPRPRSSVCHLQKFDH